MTVGVALQVFSQFLLEMFYRIKVLQIKRFAFKKTKKFSIAALFRQLFLGFILFWIPLCLHPLVLLVRVPALVVMENYPCSVWDYCRSFIQHSCYQVQDNQRRYNRLGYHRVDP